MIHRLEFDFTVPLDRFLLAVDWSTSEPFLGIFGPSGAGKSTILETIAGLRGDASGIVKVDGRTWLDTAAGITLAPERRGVGYVPQDALLFPHRDVAGNLSSGRRRLAGGPDPAHVVAVLELGGILHRDVRSLSGGERRRVALGRALCSGPDLLLLDEPIAGLDLPLRRRILPYLIRAREEFAIPTIFVSHDPTETWMLSGEVVVLDAGRILAKGRPGEVFTRETIVPMARRDGFENILSGKVTDLAGDTATVELEPGLRLLVPAEGLGRGQGVTIGLLAEDLILAVAPPAGLSAQNTLPGTIRQLRRVGGIAQVQVVVQIGKRGAALVVAVTSRAVSQLGLKEGIRVHLIAKVQSCRILARSGPVGDVSHVTH